MADCCEKLIPLSLASTAFERERDRTLQVAGAVDALDRPPSALGPPPGLPRNRRETFERHATIRGVRPAALTRTGEHRDDEPVAAAIVCERILRTNDVPRRP